MGKLVSSGEDCFSGGAGSDQVQEGVVVDGEVGFLEFLLARRLCCDCSLLILDALRKYQSCF